MQRFTSSRGKACEVPKLTYVVNENRFPLSAVDFSGTDACAAVYGVNISFI